MSGVTISLKGTFADTFKKWTTSGYEDIDGFCKSVSRELIETNNDSLAAGRYIGTGEEGETAEVIAAILEQPSLFEAEIQKSLEQREVLQKNVLESVRRLRVAESE